MARNAFSALGLSDDEDDTPRVTKPRKTTGQGAPKVSNRSDNLPAGNRGTRRGVKSEKNGNKQRGGRPAGTTKKREFDRHVSGTGRGRGVKKGGGGAHNWGKDGAEATGADASDDVDEIVEAEAEDEGPAGISYADWQAQEAERLAGLDAFKPKQKKKVNTDFEGRKMVKRSEGEARWEAAPKKSKKKKEIKQKNLFLGANITVQSSDDRPQRRDRDDRRGGNRDDRRGGNRDDRRGRGGGGGNSQRGGNRSLKLNDTNAFPALG